MMLPFQARLACGSGTGKYVARGVIAGRRSDRALAGPERHRGDCTIYPRPQGRRYAAHARIDERALPEASCSGCARRSRRGARRPLARGVGPCLAPPACRCRGENSALGSPPTVRSGWRKRAAKRGGAPLETKAIGWRCCPVPLAFRLRHQRRHSRLRMHKQYSCGATPIHTGLGRMMASGRTCAQCATALPISSVIFFASPSTMIVLSR